MNTSVLPNLEITELRLALMDPQPGPRGSTGVGPSPSRLAHTPDMIRPQAFRDAALHAEGIQVGELLALHGRATLPALLLVVAVLCTLPLVGLGTALAFTLFAIALKWPAQAAGRRAPLAGRLHGLRLHGPWSRRCLQCFAWIYEQAGTRLRRRWLALRHPRTAPGWRLWIAAMALIILLPLPLGNLLPGLSLVLLALGWIYKDGAALALSMASGAAAIGLVALQAQLLVSVATRLWPA